MSEPVNLPPSRLQATCGGDRFAITVPGASGGASVMVMDRLGGRDQIVATAASSSWAAFERPLPGLLHAWVSRDPGLVVDVGANTGFYALLAACASTDAQVLAFEPYAPVFEVLARNIADNACGRRIEAVPLALSRAEGMATLYVPTQEHGLMETSSSLEASFKAVHSAAQQVRAMTLDGFLAGHPRGRDRVTLIKVDVEGHDAAVLEGARRTIARSRPLLFVEVLPHADTATLNRFLAEEGYANVPLRLDAPLRRQARVDVLADAWNHALVPAEAAAGFLQLA